MPELSDQDLAALREAQKEVKRCHMCLAQTWKNYCRACDEHFEDGHWPVCARASHHAKHRKY